MVSRDVLTNTDSYSHSINIGKVLHTCTINETGRRLNMDYMEGGYKSFCSLQSIRVKLRAEPGGKSGEGKCEKAEREDEGRGWHPGKCGKGPIKVKARGNMNDLALKHTRDTDIYVKMHTSTECNIKLSVILRELLCCVFC